MSERGPVIAIVGLGPMGLALGRALAAVRTNYRLVGHDRSAARARAAAAEPAFDKIDWNLVHAVEGADLVLLAEPVQELTGTMADIAAHLKDGALVMDTAAVKGPVLAAAADALPARVSFIGGHPVVDAAALADADAPAAAPAAADEDAAPPSHASRGPFQGAVFCLVPLPSAGQDAMRVAGQLVEAIGAEPYFIDAGEHDALVAGVEALPGLLGASLLRVVAGSPSSRDLQRLAGPAFQALAGLPPTAAAEALAASGRADLLLPWLDAAIGDLSALRRSLAEGDDEALNGLAARGAEARAQWWKEDESSRSAAFREMDESRGTIRQMLFGRLGQRRHRAEEDGATDG